MVLDQHPEHAARLGGIMQICLDLTFRISSGWKIWDRIISTHLKLCCIIQKVEPFRAMHEPVAQFKLFFSQTLAAVSCTMDIYGPWTSNGITNYFKERSSLKDYILNNLIAEIQAERATYSCPKCTRAKAVSPNGTMWHQHGASGASIGNTWQHDRPTQTNIRESQKETYPKATPLSPPHQLQHAELVGHPQSTTTWDHRFGHYFGHIPITCFEGQIILSHME